MSLSTTLTASSKGPGKVAVRNANFRFGRSVSGANPATDISTFTDNAFQITVNGSGPYLVEVNITPDLKNGTEVAKALQHAIRGVVPSDPKYNQAFREFNVDFQDGIYSLYSGLPGDDSAVVITNAISNNIADDLKLGLANGGTQGAVWPKDAAYIEYVEVANTEDNPIPVSITDANVTVVADDLDVALTHTGPDADSIRIGDGTDLLAINPDGSINVNFAGSSAGTPTIANVTATLANTEYSYVLPTNTKKFAIKARGNSRLQVAYNMGDTGTQYYTVSRGASYLESDITLGLGFTVYFQADKPNEVVEILSWA